MVLSTSSSNSSMISMTRRVLKADQFELLRELGSGSFGAVYQAMDKITGQIVAIKKIDMENSDDDLEEIQKEISILAGCNDTRITRYYGSFVNGYKLWIIMEHLGGGSCLDLIHATGPFNEAAIAHVLYDLLRGLQYLHHNGKIHRDIKAANLLVSDLGDVKIADFGVASQLSSNLSCRNTFVGTPFWMAPEVIGQKDYTYSADIWSLGITAIELATGKPPLSHLHPMEVLFFIPKNMPPRLDEKYSKDFRDFVAKCLVKRPEDRATIHQLIKHTFLRNASKKEVVTRVHEWKRMDNSRNRQTPVAATVDESSLYLSDNDGEWVFDTVKPKHGAAAGTVTGTTEIPSAIPSPESSVASRRVTKKLSRAGNDISLAKKGSDTSMSSQVSVPATYQNFDLTPHNPLQFESSNVSYYDISAVPDVLGDSMGSLASVGARSTLGDSMGTVGKSDRSRNAHGHDSHSLHYVPGLTGNSTASSATSSGGSSTGSSATSVGSSTTLTTKNDRRTHLVKVFSHAAHKFNDRSLAEIADILTMEPIPSQVESYLVRKIGGTGSHHEAPRQSDKGRRYDSVESMLLSSWFNESIKRQRAAGSA